MANLIITIISIALVALAAVMAIYYGGIAYQQFQVSAIANALVNESQQLLTAERFWATNANQADISAMPSGTTTNNITYFTGTGTGISLLLNTNLFATWPPFGGTLDGPVYVLPAIFNSGPAPGGGGTVSTSAQDLGCYYYNGYTGASSRTLFAYNGANYVVYSWQINDPASAGSCDTVTGSFSSATTDVSEANHPIVQIAKAINKMLNTIPANAVTTLVPYLGLPKPPVGSTTGDGEMFYDTNGTMQTNYCYLASVTMVSCVFGPS